MSETIQSSSGVALPIGNLAQNIGYTGSRVTSFTIVYQGITYVQTLQYSGNDVINISQWVPQ